MPNRVQTLRSNVAGNRPTGRLPGELYVNWADGQLGAVNGSSTPQDLIAVRFFSNTANYAIGNYVVQGNYLYRAIAAVSAGNFNATQWSQVATLADLAAGYLPLSGGTLTGPLTLAAGSTAPTPSIGDNSTNIATTAFVGTAVPLPSTITPPMDGTAAIGVSALFARADHVHPSDTSRLALTGGALTGSLSATGFVANAATPAYRGLNYTTANVLRWAVYTDATAESGSNTGSNFSIARYNDAGAALGAALSINRASGATSILGALNVGGTLSTSSGIGISCGGNGINYPTLGAGAVGFSWTSPGVNVFVDNVAQGNIVTGRTGGALTAIYALSINGSTSQMQATSNTGYTFVWTATSSDPALKSDIVPAAKDALAAINNLKVWEYDYHAPFPDAEPQHWDWGLMADADLGAILSPAFIPANTYEGTKVYAQIRELPLIAALVKAVQQLTARVETLEAQLKGAN